MDNHIPLSLYDSVTKLETKGKTRSEPGHPSSLSFRNGNFGLEFIKILKDEQQIIEQHAPKLARRHMHGEEPVLR